MVNFTPFVKESVIYQYNELSKVLARVRRNFRFVRKNKNRIFNVPISFDIETSSFRDCQGNKQVITYLWGVGIYGLVLVGRTWDEFKYLMDDLVATLDLSYDDKRIYIYVHNLAYEFQFLQKHFTWQKVFAVDSRKPVYAITTTGLVFRCSYILSGYSLEILAKNLLTYKISKLVGDLDYSLIRTPETPITDSEMAYLVNDVKIVMCYITERIDEDGGLSKMPLTKTGYVRQFCRSECFGEGWQKTRYKEMIKTMVLDADIYKQATRAFMGGYTHASWMYVGQVLHGVASFDFTSSYPYVMVSERYPMETPRLIDITPDDMDNYLNKYACIFDIQFTGLRPKIQTEHYLSKSRCYTCVGGVVDNGRVVSADLCATTITEQDYMIIRLMYQWDKIEISNFRVARKAYLPTDFVKSILHLYKQKTKLKGVEGMEAEYLSSKEMINSAYGMMVTAIVREQNIFEDGRWLERDEKPKQDINEILDKYNNNYNRFLYYLWGVYVTAYARRNLYNAIISFGLDYVYSDTDSCKILHPDKHMGYIEHYNSNAKDKLKRAMEHHKLDMSLCCPKTKNGEDKMLGVWDFDGYYSKFKTLGAKRYLVEYADSPINGHDAGKVKMTVSGISKDKGVKYLLDKYGRNKIFDAFADNMTIPADHSGKMTHTYIDEEMDGYVVDYLGKGYHYHEESGVHLENAPYEMGIAQDFLNFLIFVGRRV